MQIGDIKSLIKGVVALCTVTAVFLAVDFGSFYLGRYGFSFPQKDDGLGQIFFYDLRHALSPGMIAATMVYFAAKKKMRVNRKQQPNKSLSTLRSAATEDGRFPTPPIPPEPAPEADVRLWEDPVCKPSSFSQSRIGGDYA